MQFDKRQQPHVQQTNTVALLCTRVLSWAHLVPGACSQHVHARHDCLCRCIQAVTANAMALLCRISSPTPQAV